MRILKTPGCSYSRDKGLTLHAPQSWRELTQDQLWYVFFLLSHFHELEEVKTYMFLRFTGIRVVRQTASGAWCRLGKSKAFHLAVWQIQSLIHQFNYIDTYENMGVRLEHIRGFHAVDVILKDVTFIDWLNMERMYQQYLKTKDCKHIDTLAGLLYRDDAGKASSTTLDEVERTSVFYWFGYVKTVFGRMFRHLFKPATEAGQEISFLELANAQLRALTDGDVTKEKQVEQTACLRALTELNEKAREADEFNKKYGK